MVLKWMTSTMPGGEDIDLDTLPIRHLEELEFLHHGECYNDEY